MLIRWWTFLPLSVKNPTVLSAVDPGGAFQIRRRLFWCSVVNKVLFLLRGWFHLGLCVFCSLDFIKSSANCYKVWFSSAEFSSFFFLFWSLDTKMQQPFVQNYKTETTFSFFASRTLWNLLYFFPNWDVRSSQFSLFFTQAFVLCWVFFLHVSSCSETVRLCNEFCNCFFAEFAGVLGVSLDSRE